MLAIFIKTTKVSIHYLHRKIKDHRIEGKTLHDYYASKPAESTRLRIDSFLSHWIFDHFELLRMTFRIQSFFLKCLLIISVSGYWITKTPLNTNLGDYQKLYRAIFHLSGHYRLKLVYAKEVPPYQKTHCRNVIQQRNVC